MKYYNSTVSTRNNINLIFLNKNNNDNKRNKQSNNNNNKRTNYFTAAMGKASVIKSRKETKILKHNKK